VSTARAIRQHWVLDAVQDPLFIIAAPLLSLGVALWLVNAYGIERGGALVITAHVVLTVAHHMPTFIRIYGDRELFARYRWSFLLGPAVPLAFALGLSIYLGARRLPIEFLLSLYLLLALWDPWHFLRQHFGFMRIYDRGNAAPPRLASAMDWWICVAWFAFAMAASADWLPGLLEDLYRSAGLPLLLWLPAGLLPALATLFGALAAAMTLVYAGYLAWCWRRGYFVSAAKLALLVCTFGVMLLTYTPNAWIQALAPGWSFALGFATVGIVHMTQYLAIVWRYDRRLAQQQRARPGVFTWLHGRRSAVGVLAVALLYTAFCLAYGDVLTTRPESRWLLALVLSVGFTSTLMHYYFDGFIWKVRHRENRAALGLADTATPADAGESWGQAAQAAGPGAMLRRQCLYFGAPLALLVAGAVGTWHTDRTPYPQLMLAAQHAAQQGHMGAAAAAARFAHARMAAELPVVRRMAELQPSAARKAELAFLVFNAAMYDEQVLPALAGEPDSAEHARRFAAAVAEAAELLEQALAAGGPLQHPGRESFTRDDAQRVLASWRGRLAGGAQVG
jgi:hypothetical protein